MNHLEKVDPRAASPATALLLALFLAAESLAAESLAAESLAAESLAAESLAAEVPVESFELENGMRFLAVRRPELAVIHGGWVAHVGSANEHPGITGISHFFEHMMFKGTRAIGTRNIEQDLEIIAEQERIQEQIRAEYRRQRERYRLGEIPDPFADDHRSPELIALEQRFQQLVQQQRDLMVKDEFDKLYTEQGASGMNAFTNEDLTGYFITVPANKLELWFLMESERLRNPVFREFYAERDVVYEERRLRTESTPTGEFDEQFNAMFWQSHPYGWPTVGWPSDLESYTLGQAEEYFETYYAPNNLTGVLVGNFDLEEARSLARSYFGRLPRGPRPVPDVVTLEVQQKAEKRMIAECDCQPQLEVRYHTVPFRHEDSYALTVLGGLLNGQTGRLYKALVLDQQIASRARGQQSSRKWAGSFSFSAETQGEATPEQLEAAWYEELRRLREQPIPAEELQKVKNNIAADAYRRLENAFFLVFQLLLYDGQGDWRYLNYWPEKTLAVTEADVKRVLETYFQPDNRAVASYYRSATAVAAPLPPELEGLPEPVRRGVAAQIEQLRRIDDRSVLERILNQMEEQKSAAPPEMQRVFPLLERVVRERLEQLAAADEGGDA